MGASELESLRAGEVHVWYLAPEAVTDPGLIERYERVLSAEEQERRRRLHFAKLRHDYLVAHVLLRTSLARYADVDPSNWRFEATRHGRPEIAGPPGSRPLRFNLSHTDGLVACAVTLGQAIGVDVENGGRSLRLMEVAERFFAPIEVADLQGLPESKRAARFFAYWTLKEAYVKARGMGLSIPLQQFGFQICSASPISITFSSGLSDDPKRWHFELFRPTPLHSLAVAVERDGSSSPSVRPRQTLPLCA